MGERKLDDMMRHHLDCMSLFKEVNELSLTHLTLSACRKSLRTAMALVDQATVVFRMLSMELYRKQCMAEALLQVNDGIFGRFGDEDEGDEVYSKIASCCLQAWPRGSKESYINEE